VGCCGEAFGWVVSVELVRDADLELSWSCHPLTGANVELSGPAPVVEKATVASNHGFKVGSYCGKDSFVVLLSLSSG
jgi:hypothetical protein